MDDGHNKNKGQSCQQVLEERQELPEKKKQGPEEKPGQQVKEEPCENSPKTADSREESNSIKSRDDSAESETEYESDASYEYVQDPNYNGAESASQPMFSKGGISYTPPGWLRKYRWMKSAKAPAAKKLKFDEDNQ